MRLKRGVGFQPACALFVGCVHARTLAWLFGACKHGTLPNPLSNTVSLFSLVLSMDGLPRLLWVNCKRNLLKPGQFGDVISFDDKTERHDLIRVQYYRRIRFDARDQSEPFL